MLHFGTRVAAVALVAAVSACSSDAESGGMPPATVNVVEAQASALPLDLTYSARIAGTREVEVRARVSGILEKRLYVEGSDVREGDVLFRIDPAPYRAAAERARAELAVAQAQFDAAQRDRDRIEPLYTQGLVSQRDRDQARSAFDGATASVAAARAALSAAELDLSWTTVRAPISGTTSREARSEGSLVTVDTDSSLLTRIVQADTLHVEFATTEQEAALLRAALAAQDPAVSVRVAAESGAAPAQIAQLSFVDTLVDPTTGTVRIRAVLDNRSGALTPGQFARVTVAGIGLPPSIVVPQRAVMRSGQGPSVWVVDAENRIAARPVRLGRTSGNLVMVLDGLAAGERYVVDGVLKVQPGSTVNPTVVSLEQAVGERAARSAA
jgi:membrane fusion protein (multidrug efflux system)